MLDLEMLNTMRRAGMLAASDDLRDGMPFDGAYVQERAEATATAYGRAHHLHMCAIRDLASEWLEGYQANYVSEVC
jgi:hypothetical protein